MNSTDDRTTFVEILVALVEIYGRVLSPPAIGLYWNALQGFPLADVQRAVESHINSPDTGQFFPKPADLIRHLQTAQPEDGHPGPEEAWGLLVRVITDEAETGVITEEMRRGWEACSPILDLGDEVGARRCFLETYAKHLAQARRVGTKPHWTITLGTDPTLRSQRLAEAIEAGRITADHARALLPGPTPASIDKVAGLLDGPDQTAAAANVATGLRTLAAALRSHLGYLETVQQEQQRYRDEEAKKKRQIQELLDEHEQPSRAKQA